MGKHTNIKKTKDEDDEEAVDCDGSGVPTLMTPLLPSISRTDRDTNISRLPATWMSLNPTLQVRLLSQRDTTTLCHGLLLPSEMEHSPWSGFATSHRGERLRQAQGGLLLSLCQKPVYMAIQAKLTRRNHIPETEKIGEL